jgi:hypothetical protein
MGHAEHLSHADLVCKHDAFAESNLEARSHFGGVDNLPLPSWRWKRVLARASSVVYFMGASRVLYHC